MAPSSPIASNAGPTSCPLLTVMRYTLYMRAFVGKDNATAFEAEISSMHTGYRVYILLKAFYLLVFQLCISLFYHHGKCKVIGTECIL